MLTIIVPDDNKPLLAALGQALLSYGGGLTMVPGAQITIKTTEQIGDISLTKETTTKAPGTSSITGEHISTTDDRDAGKLAGTSTATKPSESAPVNKTPDGPQDENGVVKNPEFCGNAADPFYKSGKHAGRWKKRQGVDQTVYDKWYAAQLESLKAQEKDTGEPAINTAAAFGGEKQDDPAPKTSTVPTDAGEFMAWISEHQAAERLGQADVDAAYAASQVAVADIFNPATAAEAIAKVFPLLQAAAGSA